LGKLRRSCCFLKCDGGGGAGCNKCLGSRFLSLIQLVFVMAGIVYVKTPIQHCVRAGELTSSLLLRILAIIVVGRDEDKTPNWLLATPHAVTGA